MNLLLWSKSTWSTGGPYVKGFWSQLLVRWHAQTQSNHGEGWRRKNCAGQEQTKEALKVCVLPGRIFFSRYLFLSLNSQFLPPLAITISENQRCLEDTRSCVCSLTGQGCCQTSGLPRAGAGSGAKRQLSLQKCCIGSDRQALLQQQSVKADVLTASGTSSGEPGGYCCCILKAGSSAWVKP